MFFSWNFLYWERL